MEIKFSKSAAKDLNAIQEYIYNDNHQAAKIVVSHIIEQIETIIAPNPGAGRAGRITGTRELVITKYPYIVPYQVREKQLYILRVLHTSKKMGIFFIMLRMQYRCNVNCCTHTAH